MTLIKEEVKREKEEYLKEVKRLLINIDMVNGFVKEGALASTSLQRIIPHNIELAKGLLNQEGTAVFFIRDAHMNSAPEFKNFSPHCIFGTEECELFGELKDLERYYKNTFTYLKNSTNFVFSNEYYESKNNLSYSYYYPERDFLMDINSMRNLKEVILNGCLTDICVKNGGITLKNYFDQMNRDIKVIVEECGVDTYDAPGHNREEVNEQALKDMETNGLIRVKKYEIK